MPSVSATRFKNVILFLGSLPEGLEVSCQNPETFYWQLRYNFQSAVFHLRSNLSPSMEKSVREVGDVIGWTGAVRSRRSDSSIETKAGSPKRSRSKAP